MKPPDTAWFYMCDQLWDIEPTPRQYEIEDWWFNSNARATLILGGERAGKSLESARLLAPLMAPVGSDEKRKLYWIVAPDYNQAKPEWEYLYTFFSKGDFVEGEPSMPFSGSVPWVFDTKLGHRVMTRSAGEVMKLASFSVAGVILAEAAQQPYEAFLKMLGRLSETGGPLIISGTLEKGLSWYADLYQRWQAPNVLGAKSWSLPTWSNTHVYPGGRSDPAILELEAETPEDIFVERYGAKPRRRYGLVLPEFDMAEHVRHLDVVDDAPIELWIDPGKTVYAVLFVQCLGLYTHVLDRIYRRGCIAQDVIPEVMGHPLFKHVELENAGVIDIAAKQQHANKSQIELWQEMAGCSFRYQYLKEDVTIETIRYRLKRTNVHHEPLLYFNDHMTNAKTPQGEALDVLAEPELWRWPEREGNKNAPKRPIDKNNHAMKAIGYGLVDRYGAGVRKRKKMKPTRQPYWGAFSLEETERKMAPVGHEDRPKETRIIVRYP